MKGSTRSIKAEKHQKEYKAVNSFIPLRKVFYISEQLLQNTKNEFQLERFYHPGREECVMFMTSPKQKLIMELIEFNEPRRSWLINNDVSSNGRIYITSPIDTTFLVLHYLRKYCMEKAMALDNISDPIDPSAARLLNVFISSSHEQLEFVADVKMAAGMQFYKYNGTKTIAWLTVKTKRAAATLKLLRIHCGHGAISQNYTRSEKFEDNSSDVDYLHTACDFIGGFLDRSLYQELRNHLGLSSEAELPPDAVTSKRKKAHTLSADTMKRRKTVENATDIADIELKHSTASESINELVTPYVAAPQKERSLSAKAKAMANGAKGTKSITSFFKK